MKTEWFNFLNQQMNGCFVCVSFPDHIHDPDPHTCPVLKQDGEKHDPWFNTLLWVCRQCSKPHSFDVLKIDDSVKMEAWVLGRSCRPDITIFDSEGNPKAFIEFRKSSSGKSKTVANELDIAWFEIDVRDGENFDPSLINDTRRFWEDLIHLDENIKEALRRFDTTLPGSTEFMPVFDDDGKLQDAYFAHKPDQEDDSLTNYLPQPHIGHYLYAHRSNLGCNSQQPLAPNDPK